MYQARSASSGRSEVIYERIDVTNVSGFYSKAVADGLPPLKLGTLRRSFRKCTATLIRARCFSLCCERLSGHISLNNVLMQYTILVAGLDIVRH